MLGLEAVVQHVGAADGSCAAFGRGDLAEEGDLCGIDRRLGHFVVKEDLHIGRSFVCREDPLRAIHSHGVRQRLLIGEVRHVEGRDKGVEILGRLQREVAEEHGAVPGGLFQHFRAMGFGPGDGIGQ